VGFINLIRLH